jgi:O-acetyl-ADP-ribose deacetylase (regulator of RNase III)
MPLQIVQCVITDLPSDAVVRFTDETLLNPDWEDPISRLAGPELLAECRTWGSSQPGEARCTASGQLPCGHVIHAVIPAWQGGGHGERELLERACHAALELAQAHGCSSVAFPLLPFEGFGWPRDLALDIEVGAIGAFLLQYEMDICVVVAHEEKYRISPRLASGVSRYIHDFYKGEDTLPATVIPMPSVTFSPEELEEALKQLDESFSQMLLRKIDEAGMTDVQCYKKANISRKLFSKIRSLPHYSPSKPTVLAFAIALELSLEETEKLLQTAGFALSHSSKFDLIVEYFIARKNYNIYTINQALFAFGQHLLGG